MENMKRWYLSFSDAARPKGQKFLGACVVSAPDLHSALAKAWRLNINPGGGVLSIEIADSIVIPQEAFNRLLSQQEIELFFGSGEIVEL